MIDLEAIIKICSTIKFKHVPTSHVNRDVEAEAVIFVEAETLEERSWKRKQTRKHLTF